MPQLSIIIPTRDRADTLVHTLRTLVAQDYQDCEILVSDNASVDNSKDVVESFLDPRVRYINTGARVSMSDNWEFALHHAQGKFITYIGDDDGFIPGAIAKAMGLIQESSMNALVWDKAQYSWPDHIDEDSRNVLAFRPRNALTRVVDGRRKLNQVLLYHELYERLPCLYNGIVLKSLINEIAASSTNGIFFNSIAPDVFSGIALSLVIGPYLLSEYPFSINGASRHSNGTSSMAPQGKDPNSPAVKFLRENSRIYDARVRMGPSVAICVMGEFLLAKQFLPNLKFPSPRWNSYVRMLIRSAKSSPRGAEILECATHTIATLGMKTRLPRHVEPQIAPRNAGMQGDTLVFRVPLAMARNIYDACQIIAGMLPQGAEGSISAASPDFIRKLMTRSIANTKDYLLSEAKTVYRSL